MQNLKLNKPNSSVLASISLFVFSASIFTLYYFATVSSINKNAADIFNGQVSRTEESLASYLVFYTNTIGSLKGFFEASEVVESAEFRNFVENISYDVAYNPISSFLYLEKVEKENLADFFKKISTDSDKSESIDVSKAINSLDKNKSEYFLLKYSEPSDPSNERLFGQDFSSIHPNAFDMAIQTNRPTVTRIFVNPYSNKNEIIVFSPVYRVGSTTATVEERKKNITGLVAATFRTKDMLDGIFLPGSEDRLIYTDVFEGNIANPDNLIYSNSIYPESYSPDFALSKVMQVGGREWLIKFGTTPRFRESVSQKNLPTYIILAGFLISIGISFIAYLVLSSRKRAIKLAETMTLDLEQSELSLRKSNRSLRIISEANQLIVRTKDEETLLHDVCNTLVKNAGYKLVWIGYIEHDEAKTVRVVAWAGYSSGYVENLNISWSGESPRGLGPTGKAIREKRIVAIPDFSKDPNFSPWLEGAKERGYVGSAAIPLIINGDVMGVLNIYSAEQDTFGEDEVGMLRELGDDVAYSISNIRISSQKEKAEKALRESERVLSEYMLNSPIYTFIKEATPEGEMRVIRASSNYSDMIGPVGKDMQGKTMRELFPKEFADRITKDDFQVLLSGKVLKIDEDFGGKNYTTIKFPIILENRKLLAGYTIDITERKKAEEVLRQSEEKFSKAFKGSPYGSALTTLDSGKIIDINDSFTQIFGYSSDEAIGNSTIELNIWVTPADRQVMVDAINKDGVVKNMQVNLRRKNGEIMTGLLSVQLINIGDNKYIYALVSDITEQEKVRAKLASKMEELQQFRSAVDNASDHIIITDPDAKIIYANRGAERTTGYSMKELIGNTPALWGGQMPKKFYDKMWRTIKTDKQPFVGELKNKKKNGQIYDAEFSISPILNDNGEIIYFVGVERDITKAKEIERSKNEFVSLASHQLRTPLTAINWYAEMLLGGDAGDLNVKQKDYVNELHGSSKRMTDLVAALLNVSRIDLGTFTINPQPTDVIKITKEVIKDLCVRIKKKDLKVVEKYEKLEKINVDPNLLTIILQNLISNAVKYTAEKGIIKISISRSDADVIMVVEDNGYGIPLHQQDRIFEKFFRADNIIPVETDGNGLGLYMVKQILESAGGSISFTSKEMEGTTFIVKIPASGMKGREGARILEQKGFGV